MNIIRHELTVASGASLSDQIILGPQELVIAIEMPAVWTAAGLSFVAIGGDTVAKVVKKDGAEVTLTVAANEYHSLELPLLLGIKQLKLRSGTSGTPVTQGSERTIVVVTTELVG